MNRASRRASQRIAKQQAARSPTNRNELATSDSGPALNRAVALHQAGLLSEAERIYRQILQAEPGHFDSLHLLGLVHFQSGQPIEAVRLIDLALAINPHAVTALNNHGIVLAGLKRFEEALVSYDRAIALRPDYADAFSNRSLALKELKRFGEALSSCDRAIVLQPDYPDAFNNRGIVLNELRRFGEALASYEHAILLRPNYPEAFNNRGDTFNWLQRFDQALASCDGAIALKPDFAEAFNNRGIALMQMRRYQEALSSYDRALAIDPRHVLALNNRGIALHNLGRLDQALAYHDQAIAIDPKFANAHHARGTILMKLGRRIEAIASFEAALTSDPDHRAAFGFLLGARISICDWGKVDAVKSGLDLRLAGGRSVITPLMLLGLSDDPAVHSRGVQSFVQSELPAARDAIFDRTIARDGRRRIAFLSPDYRRHVAGISFIEMFERFDRTRFELIGISLGPDDHSDLRARFEKAFDQFHDVQCQSDEQVAHLMKSLRVDIAVEMTPHTVGARPVIMSFRPAPIQVNLMHGGIGSGVSFIDYIVGDRVALPFDQQRYFLEAIVQLPDNHSVHDSTQAISPETPSRIQAGLPERGFVFCCFNNTWKLNAEIFEIWMRLLHQIEGSVLWLSEHNPDAKANLRIAAGGRGMDPDRLVFAPRLASLADHLARHRLADLFLDTLPANAQTTALDALWAGVPVLTCMGRSFSGRVAASQLLALGMPELVMEQRSDYEAEALRLARDPERLQALRRKIEQNRLTTPLFDTGRLVRNLEAAFDTMWDIWTRGEPPRAFRVEPTIGTNGFPG